MEEVRQDTTTERCPDCQQAYVWDPVEQGYTNAQRTACTFHEGQAVYLCSIWTCWCGGIFATQVHRSVRGTEYRRVFVATL